ncbi:ABC transporter ATP-binding protein [Paenibacillus barcinonensis]|uniref:ABC transporter ATP-binding protein n=1 Tax=Paenibacillus barcinonensis TaxID=198119 RepID=A0A2V4V8J1_PAEBA|nr:ABC transporter ATP-binding protein [Paenibacillus barcinonensis]PYE42422.1 ABC-2 type transport system ATP-binding protein [Paenibacillus barcinonensis]QKS58374.1 ABC transporter ATP-binding protein [Paenibacillus barcinonensis]
MNAFDNTEKALPDSILNVHIREAGYIPGQSTIRNIRMQVAPGELVGIIGPNGAGKSTTIKTLLGLLEHADYDVTIGGEGRYAYIPEQPVFYEYMTLWEHLDLAAAAYGIEEEIFTARAEELLFQFGMDHVRDDLPASFSKGMRQKMMLMIGFLSSPDIYIVDEPFIGLDPRATKDFLKLLDDERRRGAGVLMSTHVLDTAERICDRFILIASGRSAAEGTLDEIRAAAGMPEASLFDCFDTLTSER